MYSSSHLKRSWVEIDLTQLEANYNAYSQALPSDSKIICVVKADAYGHGSVKVCQKLNKIGVDYFAVSNIEEAKELRKKNIKGDILILGYTPVEYASDLVEYDITQSILSEEYAEALMDVGFEGKCQFAVDTGMNRIGINADDIDSCEKIVRKFYSHFELNGIFTHLCVSDSNTEENVRFTKEQICKFGALTERLSDLSLKYCHFLNSAGGLFYANKKPIVRLGIALYGLKPDYSNCLPSGICPCMTWKSIVSMLKEVKPGEYIGYGRTFSATENMIIATVPTGYADGYRRELSNNGYVLVNGKKAPVVGRVCMDQIMVDVTNAGKICTGDEVILMGTDGVNSFNADEMAERIGTIGYEIVCGISKRVPRIYI